MTDTSVKSSTPPVAPKADQSAPGAAIQTQQVGKYKVEVIREKCIGAGSCVAIAPGTFKFDAENIAEVISQNGDPDDIKLLAAQSCPTTAIIVTDTETGEQVWPPL
jgi:ferredoxin